MLHELKAESLGPRGEAITSAIQSCVHCGFCLPTCPTYRTLQREEDSPRGRILLMKHVLEGELQPEQAQPHLERCLGCLACCTACPSGVEYGELLTSYRAKMPASPVSFWQGIARTVALRTLPFPRRFRWSLRAARIGRFGARFLPRPFRAMLELAPAKLPRSRPLPPVSSPDGKRILRVGLLAGCAQQVLAPGINEAAIRVLNRHGVEVVVPPRQSCCGALAWHVGAESQAVECAEQNVAAFPADLDYIVTTAAGCGTAVREYGLVLAGHAQQAAASAFGKKCIDVAELLAQLDLEPFPPSETELKVAYHDACHLAHGQGVRAAPRRLLRQIPGVELVSLADAEMCCGSAGTYNLDQPEIAAELGGLKAESIDRTGCDVVALGNIGCKAQIEHHLQRRGAARPVLHTVELLDLAYRDELARVFYPL